MVDVMQPQPRQSICDPAAGTGGFLLAAYAYVAQQQRHLRHRPRGDQARGAVGGARRLLDLHQQQAAQGQLSIYDLRINQDFTLKQNPLSRGDLDEFVACYNAANRHQRTATWSESNPDGRWRAYPYEQLIARDKANLDIFWLRDDSLEDSASLPDPDVLAAEIMEDLQAALAQFSLILGESET